MTQKWSRDKASATSGVAMDHRMVAKGICSTICLSGGHAIEVAIMDIPVAAMPLRSQKTGIPVANGSLNSNYELGRKITF